MSTNPQPKNKALVRVFQLKCSRWFLTLFKVSYEFILALLPSPPFYAKLGRAFKKTYLSLFQIILQIVVPIMNNLQYFGFVKFAKQIL